MRAPPHPAPELAPKNQKPPDARKAAERVPILDVSGSVFIASKGARIGAEKRRKVPKLVPYQVPLNDIMRDERTTWPCRKGKPVCSQLDLNAVTPFSAHSPKSLSRQLLPAYHHPTCVQRSIPQV